VSATGNSSQETVLILGAGTWGCVLANLLAEKGLVVRLWEIDPSQAKRLSEERTLPGRLDGFRLVESVMVDSSLKVVAAGITAFVFVVPSRYFRATARLVRESLGRGLERDLAVSCSKGLEASTLDPLTHLLAEELEVRYPAALSGPSHAEEVAIGLPTTVVAASKDQATAERVQALFMTPRFRVYTSTDLVGVELGGALKNVVAIACGAAAGMGFGDNTMAALITRGLAEISRLGAAMGADPLTLAGLSGMGDLIVTCASRHSRNRRFGIALAKGASMEQALAEIGMVVEGVETAKAVEALKARYRVEMPISTQVARTLFEGVPVREAVASLMTRDPRPERDLC